MVLVIAHRGASAYHLENTIQAAMSAVDMGADYIELDLRLTKDDKVVVFHDASLDRHLKKRRIKINIPLKRFNPKTKWVKDYTYKELSKIHLTDDERVYLLEDFLRVLPKKIKYDFDVKEVEVIGGLYSLIQKYNLHKRCIITSDHRSAIRIIRMLDPKIKTGYIFRFMKKGLEVARSLEVDYVVIPKGLIVDHILFRHSKLHDFNVLVFGVAKPKTMKHLMDIGVKGIITNKPDILRQVIDSNLE